MLSAIVGTAVFATLEQDVNAYLRLAVGVVSVTAAVLTTLQAVLRFPERAEQHRTTSAEYRSVERELRSFLADYDASDRTLTEEQARQAMEMIRKRLDELEIRAPELAERDAAGPGRGEQPAAGGGGANHPPSDRGAPRQARA